MAVVMASGGDGLRSVRRTEEGGRVFRGQDEDAGEREKGEGSGTSPWCREEVGEAATAKQEVEASACARACVLLRLCLLAEVEDSRFRPVGWAASWSWARWAARWASGKSSALCFYLLFSIFCNL